MDQGKSVAHSHDMNHFGMSKYPDCRVPWREAEAPTIEAGCTIGSLRSCAYCGSMHPADVAAAIRSGAKGHWADFKYGWPHKAYLDGIPNPHAGMLESRMSCSHATPVCRLDGKPCVHGDQNPDRPHKDCTCLAPDFLGERPADGLRNGAPMRLALSGFFDSGTGKPGHTWRELGKPAQATTHGKFYTVHLQDASPEDRATIEQHLGLSFEFTSDGGVRWRRYGTV